MITAEMLDSRQLRELLLAGSDVAFVLDNPGTGKGGAVIYITENAEFGKLDLTIRNNRSAPVEIDTGSVLRIYACPLLTETELARIKVLSADWTKAVGSDYLELRSTRQRTIGATPLMVSFADVMTSGEATTGFFTFEFEGFKGVRDDSQRVTVIVQHPPQGEPAPLVFDTGARPEYAGQQSRTIYVTPWAITPAKAGIANRLILQAGNGRADAPLRSGPHSKIVVSFVSGASNLSLCSDEQIKVAAAKVVQGKTWRIEKDSSGPVPIWTLRPPEGAANFFDPAEIVGCSFDPIVSQLPAGFASPMFLQFANIPGYNDGYTAFFLQKVEPVPFIRSFDPYAGSRKLAKDTVVGFKENITLAWDVFGAETCRIPELNREFSPAESVTVLPAEQTVRYTLSPRLRGEPYQELKASTQLAVGRPVVQMSARAVNRSASSGPPSVEATLQWNCSNGSHCTIRNGANTWENLPLTGSRVVTLTSDQTYAITCHGAGSTSSELLVECPTIEATLCVDSSSGYNRGASVQWSTKYADSVEVSEPGYQEISRAKSGSSFVPLTDMHPPENHTSPGPFVTRWVRSFQLVAKRKNNVVKSVIVTNLSPKREA